jgi:hypothetical protein
MKYATHRLLDSVWTLGYKIVKNEIVIYEHSRDLKVGYDNEKHLPQFRLQEDNQRTVTGVYLKDYSPAMEGLEKYSDPINVSNPKFVFSY